MPRPPTPLLPLRSRAPVATGTEWVGGRFSAPVWVTEGDPYRPVATCWLELPADLIVAMTLDDPRAPQTSFGDTLRAALLRPLAGVPRRPERVRVSDPALADELGAAFGDDLPVIVGPTPELDNVLAHMAASFPGEREERSYLDGGRLPAAAVGDLFAAAAMLWTVRPWDRMDDDHLLRVDVPRLDVRGACLSVIGAAGQSFGFVLFPSLTGYQAFVRTKRTRGRIDFGTDFLSLDFERGADVPAGMRREIAEHGWPVADARAHPIVRHCERDGLLRPLTDRDLRLLASVARAVASFAVRHGDVFHRPSVEPVSESYAGAQGLVVRLTAPYEAFSLFEPAPAAQTLRASRNAPCPCGSGRKYKKCHLPTDTAPAGRPAAVHLMDERLVTAIWRWGITEHPAITAAAEVFHDPGTSVQLFLPWAVYHACVDGMPLFEHYVARRGRYLSAPERAWLDAQRQAWLGIWEMLEVAPHRLKARDLLSGAVRTIDEVSGSRTLVARDTILARVVTHEGQSVLCGSHDRVLPPQGAAEVVRRARGRLRRKGDVPVDRLRDEAFTRYLITRWEDAVADLDIARQIPPQLHNTDGDPLLFTTDRFEIAPGTEAQVESRLAAIDGAVPPALEDTDRCIGFVKSGNAMHRAWENTSIGTVRFAAGALQVETNSTARADALRAKIEAACGDLVRHRAREQTDPLTALATAREPVAPMPEPPPEALVILREMKARHYAAWIDDAIPALDGRSPRQAMATAEGRARLDLLLRDIENRESRLPQDERYDVRALRAQLGLDEPAG